MKGALPRSHVHQASADGALSPGLSDLPAFPGSQPTAVWRLQDELWSAGQDALAVEEPLEVRLLFGPSDARVERAISVTMRTPGQDGELAVGFLVSEGVIRDADEILSVNVRRSVDPSLGPWSRGNSVRVELAEGVQVNLRSLERNFYTTSSCGICGKASLLALRSVCPPRRTNTLLLDGAALLHMPATLRAAQPGFDQTGGLHAAGLFRPDGTLRLLREDVGRHNAVDKLLGAELLRGEVPLRDSLLLLSGRASFELLQKAVMGGIPAVAAVGAPSSLAVEVAREWDLTLVGFLRPGRFNVYHGAERMRGAPGKDRA